MNFNCALIISLLEREVHSSLNGGSLIESLLITYILKAFFIIKTKFVKCYRDII